MNFPFGEIAGLISFGAYVLYIISIVKGQTKPSRSTWWILTLVGFLIFMSSYSIGARENIWIQLVYTLGPLAIAILSLNPKFGYGVGFSLLDKICFFSALIFGLIWFVFNAPLVAFLGSIIVDFIGIIPTIKKAYIDPKEEDKLAWILEFLASIFNALGITLWFVSVDKSWIYALYLLFINGLITGLLFKIY